MKETPGFYERRFMDEALLEAEQAALEGEVPVGAVVVFMAKIVGRGHNRMLNDLDPTAHAELVALRQAAATLRNYRLVDCDLYATIEPCGMCAGAMVHARIRHLFFGALDSKGGAAVSTQKFFEIPQLNHRVSVHGGFCAEQCAALLQNFFGSKRV